jgi:hypothetical protein
MVRKLLLCVVSFFLSDFTAVSYFPSTSASLLLLLLLLLVDVWGLDEDGNFHNEDSNDQLLAASQERTAGLVPVTSHPQRSLVSFTSTRTKNVKSIASIIQKEMEILHLNLKKEQIRLTNRNRSSNIRKGGSGESSRLSSSLVGNEQFLNKRLLFLFQRDLLPGISGEILENKDKRDNYHNTVNEVSIYWKYAR